jgi:hypothetical protein
MQSGSLGHWDFWESTALSVRDIKKGYMQIHPTSLIEVNAKSFFSQSSAQCSWNFLLGQASTRDGRHSEQCRQQGHCRKERERVLGGEKCHQPAGVSAGRACPEGRGAENEAVDPSRDSTTKVVWDDDVRFVEETILRIEHTLCGLGSQLDAGCVQLDNAHRLTKGLATKFIVVRFFKWLSTGRVAEAFLQVAQDVRWWTPVGSALNVEATDDQEDGGLVQANGNDRYGIGLRPESGSLVEEGDALTGSNFTFVLER